MTAASGDQPTGPEITGMVRSVAKFYSLAALDEVIRAAIENLARLKQMRRDFEVELSEPDPFKRLLATTGLQRVNGVYPDPAGS